LSEILSRGLLHWWRWARLGLTSVAAIGLGHVGIAAAYGLLTSRAAAAAADLMLGVWLVAAVVLVGVVVVVCWLAGLRGAWLLGDPTRRSAVLAWIGGLVGTMRQPVSSLATLALWALPAVAAAALPLIAGWQIEALRSPMANGLLSGFAGLIQALCWVGLFLSFAPTSGFTENSGLEKS
jgi:hypothetical protein